MTNKICIGLGGLCETSYQLERLQLRNSTVFDWIITPSTSLINILNNDFPCLFPRDSLKEDGVWDGKNRVVHDVQNDVMSVHDFPLDKSFDEAYDTARNKFDYLTKKTRYLFKQKDLVLFHRFNEEDWQQRSSFGRMDWHRLWAAIRDYRFNQKMKEEWFYSFYLVIVNPYEKYRLDDNPMIGETGAVFDSPISDKYVWQGDNNFWDDMIGQLKEKGVL